MSIFFHRSRSSSRGPASTRRLRRGGFTLVELLVVISIMMLLMVTFLLQQKRFDSSTLMRSLAYNIAVSVRQAQVYGTSVRQFPGQSGFNYSYGVYFDKNNLNSYVLFADLNNNKVYDSGESVQIFTLARSYSINKFCAVINITTQNCSSGAGTPISFMSIYFKRPNPDAQFGVFDSGGAPVVGSYSSVTIEVIGPSGDTRAVTVTTTGQISVGQAVVGS